MLASAEELNFKLVLSGTYWRNKPPEFEILFDNQLVLAASITKPSSSKGIVLLDDNAIEHTQEYQTTTLETFEFSRTVEPGNHVLGIRLKNKADGDTRGFVPDGWTRDLLLHVEKITINDVDLHNLIFSESKYVLDQLQTINGNSTDHLTNCVSLGFNGVYQLPLSSPFYIWLLERL
jgi:hypothetical protein